MYTRRSNVLRPNLGALEGRQLLAASIASVGGGGSAGASAPIVRSAPPPAQIAVPPVLTGVPVVSAPLPGLVSAPPSFDTTLTVSLVTDHRVNPATSYIMIDGSDYDDHIQ